MAITLINATITIISALVGATGFWTIIEKKNEEKRIKREEKFDNILTELNAVKEESSEIANLSKALSRDRLNHLSEQFVTLGYIPKEDFVSYSLLGKAYLQAKGNSEVAAKFDYCVNNLEVK